jgi:photosystem II stability/assembly factor-like uncharacterized protein
MNKFFFLLLCLFCFLVQESGFSQELKPIGDEYFNAQNSYQNFLINLPSGTKPGNKWMNRWLWNNRNNIKPMGFKSPRFEYINKSSRKTNQDNQLSGSGWLPVGPISIPPSYEPRSCYSMGRVNCVAFHPTNPDILWIGTPGGGVWKSINGGKSWLPISDNLSTLCISHIAVNPVNPDVLYIATGDFDIGGMTDDDAQGVFKSIDGGLTWEQTGLSAEQNFQGSILRKIIINPTQPDKLLAAGRRGIWKSEDAGTVWTRVCDSIIVDAELHPQNPNVILAATGELWGSGSCGVLKSTDFGESWVALDTKMPPKGEIRRTDIAISPADPNYIYALNVRSNTNGLHSFYSSTDGGNSWKAFTVTDSNDNILGAWGGDISDRYGQGSYDLVLLADPTDKNKVYTGGVNMWMSENGGKDWELVSFWIYCFGPSIHADHHYAAYNPLDKGYYWCNDGGIYRTKQILPGSKKWINEWIDKHEENKKPGAPDVKFPTVWENLSDGLAITEFYRMSLSKNVPDVLAAGSQDNSCYYFGKGDWLNYIPNYDGMETMIDNDNANIFYGVWQFGGLCRSMDGGKTITPRLADTIANLESGNWVTPVAMDPSNSKTIYIGFKNLWRSDDRGNNWKKIFDFDSTGTEKLNRNSLQIIKVSPVNENYISIYKDAGWYQDTAKIWRRAAGELWISKNKGFTFVKSTNGLPLDSINISSIDYDDKDPLKMWASVSTWYNTINLYLTTDGGGTWKDISKPIPYGLLIRTIVHQPNSFENTVYCGTNKGVYFTNDSLTEWKRYSDELPNTFINELEIQESTNELFAATYGRGVWKTNLLPNDVNDISIESCLITVSPNPSDGNFTLTFQSKENEFNHQASIRIIDINGRELFTELADISSEIVNIPISTTLVQGAYFIEVAINRRRYSAKILISN